MNYTYKIATLNINAISSPMKIQMVTNFFLRQGIDITVLQAVANNDLFKIYGYSAHINIGTEKRGTAILMKEGISVNNIKTLPSGRGIAGLFEDTWLINVYTPSVAEKRHEWENFFTTELAYLLPTGPTEILLAGDFNCVLSPADCTGAPNLSKALSATKQDLPYMMRGNRHQSNFSTPSTRTVVPQQSTGYISQTNYRHENKGLRLS